LNKIDVLKCKLKDCLNIDKTVCSIACSPFLKDLKPDSVSCPFFDNDFKKTYSDMKKKGGVIGILLNLRKRRTEEELSVIKKEQRKDKKKKKRTKEENTLTEMM